MKKKKSEGRSNSPALSLSKQRYIETIDTLSDEEGHAHVKDIADRLGVKMSSVTETARYLQKLGLVEHSARRQICLTAEGRRIADELDKKHRVLADFFHEILGCSKQRAESFACEIEHIIDERLYVRFTEFVRFLRERLPLKDGKNPIEEFKAEYDCNA